MRRSLGQVKSKKGKKQAAVDVLKDCGFSEKQISPVFNKSGRVVNWDNDAVINYYVII